MHNERGSQLNEQQLLQKLQIMDPHARTTLASPSVSMDVDALGPDRTVVMAGARVHGLTPFVAWLYCR
jgi:hypothetical protein